MAAHTVASNEVGIYDVALAANTVDTVQFARDLSEVEVGNFTGTEPIYVCFVDQKQTQTATVKGKHCFPVYPNSVATIPVRTDGPTLVHLVSAAATKASVNAT